MFHLFNKENDTQEYLIHINSDSDILQRCTIRLQTGFNNKALKFDLDLTSVIPDSWAHDVT